MTPTDEYKIPEFPFTEEQFLRISTNLHIIVGGLTRRDNTLLTPEDKHDLYVASEEMNTMAHLLFDRFFLQFNHSPSARRICPNPGCRHIYAFFFDDWRYCPQCGAKLIKTMYNFETGEYTEEEA